MIIPLLFTDDMKVFFSLSFGGIRAHYFDDEKPGWISTPLSPNGNNLIPLVFNPENSERLGEPALNESRLTNNALTDAFLICQNTDWAVSLVKQAIQIIEKEVLYQKVSHLYLYLHPELEESDYASDLESKVANQERTVTVLDTLSIPSSFNQDIPKQQNSLLVLHLGYKNSVLSFFRRNEDRFVEDKLISREQIMLGEGSIDWQLEKELSEQNDSALLRQLIRSQRDRLAKDKRTEWSLKANGESFSLNRKSINSVTNEISIDLCTKVKQFTARIKKIYPQSSPQLLVFEDESPLNRFDITPLKISLPRIYFTSPSLILEQLFNASSTYMSSLQNRYQEFYILASDGCQYGPASKETISRWIEEGRLSGNEQIMPIHWHPVSELFQDLNS